MDASNFVIYKPYEAPECSVGLCNHPLIIDPGAMYLQISQRISGGRPMTRGVADKSREDIACPCPSPSPRLSSVPSSQLEDGYLPIHCLGHHS